MIANTWRAWFAATVATRAQVFGFGRIPVSVIVAQAALETGTFTSAIFRENNNAFGLKEPRIRPTTATGTNRGHATFASVDECITDYFLRQRYFGIDNGPRYIADTVESGYAEARNYAQAWSRLIEQRAGMPTPGAAIVPVALPLAVWIAHRRR